ncbi:MAG: 1-propanol dehydrogenase PduQ [Oscillospiraceae bacterium]
MNTFSIKTKIILEKPDFTALTGRLERVFIVTDKFMAESGKTDYITKQLEAENIAYKIFSQITPDPDIDIITKGIEIISSFPPDLIIALGGGSAIDAAKAITYFAKKTSGLSKCTFIAIPTTSGTGSEVTRFAVISDNEKKIKYPMVDQNLLPDYAVLDPTLTLSVPPSVTADTGIDVITHAIEAYLSTEADDFSDALAEKAFQLAFLWLVKAVKTPNDTEARKAMHHASCLAGMAFDNASLGLNHSMAHILGARTKLPHGRANGILLPYVTAFNAGISDNSINPKIISRYAALAHIAGLGATTNRQSTVNLIKGINKLLGEINMPKTLAEAGVEKASFIKQLDEISLIALEDRCTKTNPRPCTAMQIKEIFLTAYGEEKI